jgi:hypothetical protein
LRVVSRMAFPVVKILIVLSVGCGLVFEEKIVTRHSPNGAIEDYGGVSIRLVVVEPRVVEFSGCL